MITFTVADGALRRKLAAMYARFQPARRRRIMRRLGIELRDAVRARFTTQGDGTWAPPSDWIAMKTGRRKALLPLRSRIHYRLSGNDTVDVFFDAPTTDWNINMHHEGFVSPPVDDKSMAIPLRTGGFIRLRSRGASVIPARRIWLTPAQTRRIVAAEMERFARELEAA